MIGSLFKSSKPKAESQRTNKPPLMAMAIHGANCSIAIAADSMNRAEIVVRMPITEADFDRLIVGRAEAKLATISAMASLIPVELRQSCDWIRSRYAEAITEDSALESAEIALNGAIGTAITRLDESAIHAAEAKLATVRNDRVILRHRLDSLKTALAKRLEAERPSIEALADQAIRRQSDKLPDNLAQIQGAIENVMAENMAPLCHAIGAIEGMKLAGSSANSALAEAIDSLGKGVL